MVNFASLSLLIALCVCNCCARDSKPTHFGVGLTTIPPRFSTVHHVISSWLQQDFPPAIIVIFIPQRYTMFANGVGKKKNKNFIFLQDELRKHFSVDMAEGRVDVQMIPKDLGPLSKYIGMLKFISETGQRVRDGIDHWVIGDDDVHYAPHTLSGYAKALVTSPSLSPGVMTHFQVHARLEVLIRGQTRQISHIQGVDTVMFSEEMLKQHATSPLGKLTYERVVKIAEFFHGVCPESFFQDDYIMSAVLFAAQVPVTSIWNGSKVALHVDDVSTSFQQMHLSVDVFKREQATKHCVEANMHSVLRAMQGS